MSTFLSRVCLAVFLLFTSFVVGAELIGRTTDWHSPVDYKVGEPIHFELKAVDIDHLDQMILAWECLGDDGQHFKGEITATERAIIETSLKKPGFIWVRAKLLDAGRKQVTVNGKAMFFDGGAAAELDKLQPPEEPKDFDAFWTRQKERVAQLPMQVEKKLLRKNQEEAIYTISVNCPGPKNQPVTAYMTIPAGAAPKSLKIQIELHGYGFYTYGPNSARRGTIMVGVNAHGYELEREADYYKAFGESIKYKGSAYAWSTEENANAEQSYFNGMALRLIRILQYVQTLPEWNGRDLIVHGESQGGLQGLWCAALDPHVTECNIAIPWCADFTGMVGTRIRPAFQPPATEALGYYSTLFHAKRIPQSCRVNIYRAGLGDYVCPPYGVALMFNNLSCPAEIRWCQGSSHNYVPSHPDYTYIYKY